LGVVLALIWGGFLLLDPGFHEEGRYHWVQLVPPLIREPICFALAGMLLYLSLIFATWRIVGWIVVFSPSEIRFLSPFGARTIAWTDLQKITIARPKWVTFIQFQAPRSGLHERLTGVAQVTPAPVGDVDEQRILDFIVRFRPDLVPPRSAASP
jgi:hypothetical protein